MADIRRMAVNWVDGMKISRQHFLETDHYHLDQVRRAGAALLSPMSYGLLLPKDGIDPLEVQVLGDAGNQIRVKVNRCQAITPDGSVLDIEENDDLKLDTSLAGILEQYRLPMTPNIEIYLVISIGMFERQPAGTPAESEMPVRHPYTLPLYRVSLVPSELINIEQWGGPALIVGKLACNNGEIRVLHDFVPASRAVRSHKNLREWHSRWSGYLNDIEMYSFRILQKIKLKSQKSTLSDSVQMMVERLVGTMTIVNISFQRLAPWEPPVQMATSMIQSAQAVRTSLECLTDREKEELLAYLAEWADESPGSIEKQLLGVVQVAYNHNDILPCLRIIDGFYTMWTALFLKLSQLEFIGKRKGQQVFIIESPVHEPPVQPEKAKSRWSPL